MILPLRDNAEPGCFRLEIIHIETIHIEAIHIEVFKTSVNQGNCDRKTQCLIQVRSTLFEFRFHVALTILTCH